MRFLVRSGTECEAEELLSTADTVLAVSPTCSATDRSVTSALSMRCVFLMTLHRQFCSLGLPAPQGRCFLRNLCRDCIAEKPPQYKNFQNLQFSFKNIDIFRLTKIPMWS